MLFTDLMMYIKQNLSNIYVIFQFVWPKVSFCFEPSRKIKFKEIYINHSNKAILEHKDLCMLS